MMRAHLWVCCANPCSGGSPPLPPSETPPLAIYSANHGSIGRSTHAAGTAAAHGRYIARPAAASALLGVGIPLERNAAGAWLEQQEAGERKNGRVIDKVRVALPVELNAKERAALVTAFCQEISQDGRASWLAAVHDRGEDAHNPHAHIIIRDKDRETGKRVAMLSEKGSTERIREAWERHTNQALAQAGHETRVDRRTLAAQGIEREATKHLGAAEILAKKGVETPRWQENEAIKAGNTAREQAKAAERARKADPLVHWRKAVEEAERKGGGFQIEDAKGQLAKAAALLAEGKPPAHHHKAILDAGMEAACAWAEQQDREKKAQEAAQKAVEAGPVVRAPESPQKTKEALERDSWRSMPLVSLEAAVDAIKPKKPDDLVWERDEICKLWGAVKEAETATVAARHSTDPLNKERADLQKAAKEIRDDCSPLFRWLHDKGIYRQPDLRQLEGQIAAVEKRIETAELAKPGLIKSAEAAETAAVKAFQSAKAAAVAEIEKQQRPAREKQQEMAEILAERREKQRERSPSQDKVKDQGQGR